MGRGALQRMRARARAPTAARRRVGARRRPSLSLSLPRACLANPRTLSGSHSPPYTIAPAGTLSKGQDGPAESQAHLCVPRLISPPQFLVALLPLSASAALDRPLLRRPRLHLHLQSTRLSPEVSERSVSILHAVRGSIQTRSRLFPTTARTRLLGASRPPVMISKTTRLS